MSALFRETAAGNFIHIISKGKLLRYPEEQPSFIVPDTLLHPNPPETPTHPNHSDTSTLVDPEAQVVKSEENRAEKSLDHTIVGCALLSFCLISTKLMSFPIQGMETTILTTRKTGALARKH